MSKSTEATTNYGALLKALPEDEELATRDDADVSYWELLRNNQEYRFFLSSYLITHCGEWLTYIASIDFIESRQENADKFSRTKLSILVMVRLLPNVILAGFGGTLADAYDRRKLMILLDMMGALSALIFVLAYDLKSILLIYVATFLQQSIAGLYQPSSNSLPPLLVRHDSELKKATTLAGLAWSCMAAFGAAASGFIVDAVGSRSCFEIDAATYLASAFFLWLVRGDYNVSDPDKKPEPPWDQFKGMILEGAKYLSSSFFGALVLLKATGAIAWGACDVLNVALSELGDASDNNRKIGILFSVVGVGCLLGPLLTEPCVDLERPTTVQLSCVISFGICTIGYLGWSFVSPFPFISLVALLRSAGASTVWINSTLLLQKFSSPQMLGRVLAVDYALALLAESLSAYICGILIDRAGLSPHEVSFVLTIISLVLTLVWSLYHISGRGAGIYKACRQSPKLTNVVLPANSETTYLSNPGVRVQV